MACNLASRASEREAAGRAPEAGLRTPLRFRQALPLLGWLT
jgi:hypothetical protein